MSMQWSSTSKNLRKIMTVKGYKLCLMVDANGNGVGKGTRVNISIYLYMYIYINI